jgi:hypothetical protein
MHVELEVNTPLNTSFRCSRSASASSEWKAVQPAVYHLSLLFLLPIYPLSIPLVHMIHRQTQFFLDSLDLIHIPSVLPDQLLDPTSNIQQERPTLPISSESFTQLRPLILLSLMTIFSGVDTVLLSDAFLKSFVRNVPIPNEATISMT